MLAVKGFYDGENFKSLEKVNAKKNQKVIITILDEEIEKNNVNKIKPHRKFMGKWNNQDFIGIEEALKDTERIDENEW
jgi:hypothetical protein